MKIKGPALNGLAGRSICAGIWGWMRTLRYEASYADRTLDPVLRTGGPRVYLVWHEAMLAPLYLRPGCDCSILVSRHRDADLLAVIARVSGFHCVRGSTYRGGATALRALAKHGRSRHLVITPDGPRGPRRRVAQGPIYLASKLGAPIVPVCVAYDRCWRTNTWDRFLIPKPFTTARLVMGSEMLIAPNLDREALETRRVAVQREMLRLTREAEAWAATRQPRPEAVPTTRQRPLHAGGPVPRRDGLKRAA
ncbi:lysophospholipid acyltransferase family protein [Botrimarina sp.]|uniref:lysophospholipid acyltransferase family protein n=1 Tax=Botrimarina sp. TaxID=2795802 RepID=UPI0032EFF190